MTTDTEGYIRKLLEGEPLREPLLRSVIQALHLPQNSNGLDVGCGIGLQVLLLADILGPQTHVTGADIDPDLLAFGKELARKAGKADQITFREADMNSLPFQDATFDWVWSADCAGYPAGELAPVLDEFMRVVKPGGTIAILGWSSQQVLPGYPLLEARLNATASAYIPFFEGKSPEFHLQNALRWFSEKGVEEPKAQTFVRDVQSPITRGERTALASLFEMLWEEPAPAALPGDRSEYQRLCKPESPDFIADTPGYYAFFTYTVFWGKKRK